LARADRLDHRFTRGVGVESGEYEALSARAKPAFGDPGARRFKPPYLDTQAFGRSPLATSTA